MANQFYISAGIPPIDNSSGATSNNYYIAAGLIPDDTAAGGWTGEIIGITNPSEILGRATSGISEVMGI